MEAFRGVQFFITAKRQFMNARHGLHDACKCVKFYTEEMTNFVSAYALYLMIQYTRDGTGLGPDRGPSSPDFAYLVKKTDQA